MSPWLDSRLSSSILDVALMVFLSPSELRQWAEWGGPSQGSSGPPFWRPEWKRLSKRKILLHDGGAETSFFACLWIWSVAIACPYLLNTLGLVSLMSCEPLGIGCFLQQPIQNIGDTWTQHCDCFLDFVGVWNNIGDVKSTKCMPPTVAGYWDFL